MMSLSLSLTLTFYNAFGRWGCGHFFQRRRNHLNIWESRWPTQCFIQIPQGTSRIPLTSNLPLVELIVTVRAREMKVKSTPTLLTTPQKQILDLGIHSFLSSRLIIPAVGFLSICTDVAFFHSISSNLSEPPPH